MKFTSSTPYYSLGNLFHKTCQMMAMLLCNALLVMVAWHRYVHDGSKIMNAAQANSIWLISSFCTALSIFFQTFVCFVPYICIMQCTRITPKGKEHSFYFWHRTRQGSNPRPSSVRRTPSRYPSATVMLNHSRQRSPCEIYLLPESPLFSCRIRT